MDLSNQDFIILQTKIENERYKLKYWLVNKGLVETDIEDIFQEAWFRMLKQIKSGKYHDQGNPTAYYATLARNIYYEQFRQKKKANTFHISATHEEFLTSDETEIRGLISSETSLRILYQTLAEMDDEKRLLLERKYIHQMTLKELAKLYGIAENTINQRLFTYRRECKAIAKTRFEDFALAEEEKIDRYLQNLMQEEELQSFESDLKKDADLWQEVKLSAALLFVIRNQDHFKIPAPITAQSENSQSGSFKSTENLLQPVVQVTSKMIITALTVLGISALLYFYVPHILQKKALKNLGQIELGKNPPEFLSSDEKYQKIESLYYQQKYSAVIDSLNTILQIEKFNCWFCEKQIAYSYLLAGKAKKAAQQLENQINPADTSFTTVEPHYYYAISLLLQGKQEQTIKELEKLLEKVGDQESYVRYDSERLLQQLLERQQ